MKIEGHDLSGPRTARITFLGADVTIQALPLSFQEELDRLLPIPKPRLTPALDSNGRPIRDENRQVIPVPDVADLRFIREERHVSSLRMAAAVHKALEADPNVRWEAAREAFRKPEDFYDAVLKELYATGMSVGDLLGISGEIRNLGERVGEDLDRARQGFSQGDDEAVN
jgi:hypothetical protein